ncbi:MAG: CTP synthase, partial [Patescibacteria group bacterium]
YSIYDIPVNFEAENFSSIVLKLMGLKARRQDMRDWAALAKKIRQINKEVTIGIVGKYFNFKSCHDTYISVIESINHAAWQQNLKPKIIWLEAERYEKDKRKLQELKKLGGIIVPGGFGGRGVAGMILVADYARRHNIPYLGLCLGMQILTISFARYVLKMADANSTEFNPRTKHPVIATMEEQKKNIAAKNYGGTMRLGAYPAKLAKNSLSYRSYKQTDISERHRHRYEFNNEYRSQLETAGLRIAGVNTARNLVEIVEVAGHPFMVGVQFHPEFKSRPLAPHPLFKEFIRVCAKK